MQPGTDGVRAFFEQYEKNIGAPDPTLVAAQYSESFVFAGPQGTQAVNRDNFLKALPRRQEFFKAAGLRSSRIQRLEEAHIDNSCVMVKAYWRMQFDQPRVGPAEIDLAATYVLHRRAEGLRIVFQLDHDDLLQRARDLGLAPVSQA
jgi:ketosteroid isomerase-like protein